MAKSGWDGAWQSHGRRLDGEVYFGYGEIDICKVRSVEAALTTACHYLIYPLDYPLASYGDWTRYRLVKYIASLNQSANAVLRRSTVGGLAAASTLIIRS